MKFSVNWLREFVDLPANLDKLLDLLTMAGVEIEAVETRGSALDKIVVAQITDSRPHPNADRLTICIVDDGSGSPRQIVCGAKNYKVGDKVPLALPGAKLADGLTIRGSKLRGVESEGMLCSAKELQLGDDASGLLILSDTAQVGAPLADVFPPDTIVDVEVTPNRGDLLSHFGLAREIAALTCRVATVPVNSPVALDQSGLKVETLRECPFYSARRIENVKVGISPEWLRRKIETVGVRSINNIVDVTNYVMLETGQPLHAFDADKVGGDVNVRFARNDEEFLALDGRTYSLPDKTMVIADAERAIAIAGVMGGEETGVTDQTTNVLLESAYFLPASVRQTARRLNLLTDSSYRFERRVDPRMVLPASQRATELIAQLAKGNPAPAVRTAGQPPADPPHVSLRYSRVNALLGIDIEYPTTDQILERFGLTKTPESGDGTAIWRIPSYRPDLQREVDLVEEIVRAFGVDRIPGATRSRFSPSSIADRDYDFETELRHDLVAVGLTEIRTSSLVGRSQAGNADERLQVRNPVSEDHVALRTSLVPGLLNTVGRNARAGAEHIALFEIGKSFAPAVAEEALYVGVAVCGRVSSSKSWRSEKNRAYDFFDLKGVIELVASRRGEGHTEQKLSFRRTEDGPFPFTVQITWGNTLVGLCGQLSSAEVKALDAPGPVFIAEMRLAEVRSWKRRSRSFREIERYPSATRHIAMFVPENVTHADVLAAISSAKEPLLERVELFDLFAEQTGGMQANSRTSLAYSLTYRDKNRTLTSDEVNAAHARIRERLRKQAGAQIRE